MSENLSNKSGRNHPGNGLFITFEGGEGVGKSTQIKLLQTVLERAGFGDAVFTREPGAKSIPVCGKIREIVKFNDMDVATEMLLFFADRNEHVRSLILPSLADGKIVVSDRFYDSTRAYQHANYNDPKNLEKIETLIKTFVGDCTPDLTILMDANPEKTLSRSVEGGKFEDKKIEWHRVVREAYLDLARKYPNRIKVVDAQREYYPKHVSIIDCINENLGIGLSVLSDDEVAKIVADF